MNMYTNQNAGFRTVNGIIGSISADRKTMSIKTKKWDIEQKKNIPMEVKTSSPMPFDESYQPGNEVSVVGYPRAGMISADHVFKAEGGYAEETAVYNKDGKDIEAGFGFVAGPVVFARVNEEKNADGTPKTKQDGTLRKRHFDIGIRCENEEGEVMLHIIKVYDGTFTPAGQKTPLEKYRDIFEKNADKECRAFIITSALTERDVYTNEKEYNGEIQVTTYANHMGIKSADFSFSKVLEKEQEKGVEKPEESKTPEKDYEPTVPQEDPSAEKESEADNSRPPIIEEDYSLE